MSTASCITANRRVGHRILAKSAPVLALLCCLTTHGQTIDAARRLNELEAATALDRAGLLPWRLQISFTLNDLNGKEQDKGTADVLWAGKGRLSIQVDSALLHGQLPTADEAFAAGTLREVHLIRHLLDQTIHPVESFAGATDLSISEHTRKFGKVELKCLSINRGKAPAEPSAQPGNEFCTEPSAPNVLRIHFEPSVALVRNKLGIFQQINVALDNSISYFGRVAITGHTDSLQATSASAPEPPVPQPAGSPAPVAHVPSLVLTGRKLSGAVPQYPYSARESHVSGSVILAAVVDKTGHIKDLTPIFSPDAALTSSAMTAVKTWTYSPYLLKGEAIDVSTTITVNYNLSSRFF